eukprot:GFYU01011922.1.p1 GENE.GFYU01011922.1~~GFYU01011922.1.p1  ORF type:complete len:552 (+),score=78.44 GFYU01011922.1:220-1656(+)
MYGSTVTTVRMHPILPRDSDSAREDLCPKHDGPTSNQDSTTVGEETTMPTGKRSVDRDAVSQPRAKRRHVLFEGECDIVKTTVGAFCDWISADPGARGLSTCSSLRHYPRSEWWGYIGYKHFAELFASSSSSGEGTTGGEDDDADESVNVASIHNEREAVQPESMESGGLEGPWDVVDLSSILPLDPVFKNGKTSTFWFGSALASTPCHYDTYSINWHAVIYGCKRWTLYSPDQTDGMYPTRVPYEESSVFSQVDVSDPDYGTYPRYSAAHRNRLVVDVKAGELLYIPKHWWHFVECKTTTISINNWTDLPQCVLDAGCRPDAVDRAHESLVRLIIGAMTKFACAADTVTRDAPTDSDGEGKGEGGGDGVSGDGGDNEGPHTGSDGGGLLSEGRILNPGEESWSAHETFETIRQVISHLDHQGGVGGSPDENTHEGAQLPRLDKTALELIRLYTHPKVTELVWTLLQEEAPHFDSKTR